MRLIALLSALAFAAVACGGGTTEGAASPEVTADGGVELVAQVASYDIAVGDERRIIVGLLTSDNRFVTFGDVDVAFSYVGTREAPVEDPETASEATASFLPLPGQDLSDAPDEPTIVQPSEARGVYAAEVAFDRPGIWRVEVAADVADEGELTGTAHFEVLEESQVPLPGGRAPATENLTLDSDAEPVAVDSRAQEGEEIPDPELHGTTIAEAIAEGRPLLAIFSTPVYCVSRFCGPVTEMVEELAADHGEDLAFVHVEVWKDFQAKKINDAAQEWLQLPGGNLTEPWVFLIDADGTIVARWDNVATRDEVEPEIEALLG